MATPTSSSSTTTWAKVVRHFTLLLAVAAAMIVIFMMVSTVADVTRRLIFGRPIPGVIEVGELLMVGAVFLGIAYTEAREEHVAVTLLVRRLTPRKAALVQLAGLAIVMSTLAWMIVVTGTRAYESFTAGEFRFGLVRIPVWPGRIAIALGLLALLLELLVRTSRVLKVALNRSEQLPDQGAVGPTV